MTDNSELSEFERKQIASAIDHVLSTDKFVAAPQMSAFLRYVVEQTVSGNSSRIKAYTVAVDALGKPDTFDPQNDPVVRVLAGRLRSSLVAYYEAYPRTTLIIQMRPGSYVPVFVNQQKSMAASSNPSIETGDVTHSVANATPGDSNSQMQAMLGSFSELENTGAVDEARTNKPATDTEERSTTLEEVNSENSLADKQTQSEPSPPSAAKLSAIPKAVIAAALLAVMLIASLLTRSTPEAEPQIKAASPIGSELNDHFSSRTRPEQLSIFVSATDEGNLLENQLNSMMSGVFSESERLRVYRILDPNSIYRFWPEDYVMSLDVLTLPTETRVGIQLMAAQTGRITHTDTLVLSSVATQSLTFEELEKITDFSRNLVSEKGPLVADYDLMAKHNAELQQQ